MTADRPESDAPAPVGPVGPVGPASVPVESTGPPVGAVADFLAELLAGGSPLRGYAARLLGDYQVPRSRLEVDDVVQHVAAELLARWADIREPERYVFAVAKNLIRRAAREGRRFTGVPPGPGADGLDGDLVQLGGGWLERAAWSPPPDEQAIQPLYLRQVTVALAEAWLELTPAQRRAVLLVDGHGWSRAAAAEAMAVAVGTVSSHRQRALKRLREDQHLRDRVPYQLEMRPLEMPPREPGRSWISAIAWGAVAVVVAALSVAALWGVRAAVVVGLAVAALWVVSATVWAAVEPAPFRRRLPPPR